MMIRTWKCLMLAAALGATAVACGDGDGGRSINLRDAGGDDEDGGGGRNDGGSDPGDGGVSDDDGGDGDGSLQLTDFVRRLVNAGEKSEPETINDKTIGDTDDPAAFNEYLK